VDRALVWFRRAIRLGDDNANVNIARIYLNQKGQPARALPYLKKVLKSPYATENAKEEASRLLKQLTRRAKVRPRRREAG